MHVKIREQIDFGSLVSGTAVPFYCKLETFYIVAKRHHTLRLAAMGGSSLKPPSVSVGQRRISAPVRLSYQSQAAPSSALQRGQLICNEEKKACGSRMAVAWSRHAYAALMHTICSFCHSAFPSARSLAEKLRDDTVSRSRVTLAFQLF